MWREWDFQLLPLLSGKKGEKTFLSPAPSQVKGALRDNCLETQGLPPRRDTGIPLPEGVFQGARLKPRETGSI